MHPRLARRSTTVETAISSGAPAGSGPLARQRLLEMVETISWAVMVLGLGAASLVLVQSYLLGG
jgi:hypothetical protein